MIPIAILLALVFAVRVAVRSPVWVWTMFVCTWSGLDLIGAVTGVNVSSVSLGSLTLRIWDPATFGIFVGTLYHLHKDGTRGLRHKPGIAILLAILVYFGFKVLWTLVFGYDQIVANTTASHSLGGLVAAVGELRDNLLAFVLPIYAYAVPKSREMKKVGWPLCVATGFLLAKAVLVVGVTGRIWSASADFRFISAHEAVNLTLFSFILFFLPVPRVSSTFRRGLALTAFVVAIVANHRSQWVAALAGTGVLLAFAVLGRPLAGTPKTVRIMTSGAALMIVMGGLLFSASAFIDRVPILSAISVRLYAVTQPSKDADAKWRQIIWRDRIRQVGDDWPWGRLLGDRRATLVYGQWLTVPDHSGYVAMYELGGVILCCLVALFWMRLWAAAIARLITDASPAEQWPPVVVLAISACTLAFGTAYDFPPLGPALAVVVLLGSAEKRACGRPAALAAESRATLQPVEVLA